MMALQGLTGRSHSYCQWFSGGYMLQRGKFRADAPRNSGILQIMSPIGYKVLKGSRRGFFSF